MYEEELNVKTDSQYRKKMDLIIDGQVERVLIIHIESAENIPVIP